MGIKRVAAFGAIYLFWGGAYLAISILVHLFPPFMVAGVRYGLAAAALAPLVLMHRRRAPTGRQILNAAWTGAAMLAVGYGVVFWAEQRLSSWLVGVLASTVFLWTYIGESLVLRSSRFRTIMLLPLFTGLAGISLLAGIHARMDHISALAVLGVLLGAVSWTAGSLVVKRIDMPSFYLHTASIQLASAGLVLLSLSGALGEWGRVSVEGDVFTWKAILAMAYLVIAATVLAFSAFHWLLAREPATLVATSAYVNPIVAMALGIAVAHEHSSPVQLLGAVAVLGSIVMVWHIQRIADPFEMQGSEGHA